MRTILLLAAVVGCTNFSQSAVSQEDAARGLAPRRLEAIQADAVAFVRGLRSSEDFEARSAKLLDLMWLHAEVVQHPEFPKSHALQSVRRELVARLREGMSAARRDLVKWARQTSNGGARPWGPAASSSSAGTPVSPSAARGGITPADLSYWTAYYGYHFDRWTGGSSQYLGYLGGNFAPPGHHADRLIRMIERSISPDSWQRNGGNSVIEYYGPAMVLVIRAEERTHDEVDSLLNSLRELNR